MALSLYPILFLVSLPVADLLMINGHPQQSCPILGVRQISAGFGSRLQEFLALLEGVDLVVKKRRKRYKMVA